jgi:hypothetical protein
MLADGAASGRPQLLPSLSSEEQQLFIWDHLGRALFRGRHFSASPCKAQTVPFWGGGGLDLFLALESLQRVRRVFRQLPFAQPCQGDTWLVACCQLGESALILQSAVLQLAADT